LSAPLKRRGTDFEPGRNKNPGDWVMSSNAIEPERRRCDRVALSLAGRYMLADGKEFDCKIVDVSTVGVAIRGPLAGDVGERVVVYVQELGRIEGVIVRRAAEDEWFALELRLPRNKLHKLASRIDWAFRRQTEGLPERRSFVRFEEEEGRTTLQLSDGREFDAAVLDVSTGGAALEVEATPPLGAAVTVGKRRAHVVRRFSGGLAVTFDW